MILLIRRFFIGVILIFCIFNISAAEPDETGLMRFGLFVGSNDGGIERVTLSFAGTDAQAMVDVMEEMGGLSSKNSLLLDDPDTEELVDGFDALRRAIDEARNSARRIEFLLYYSGHSDEFGILLGEERFSYLDLRDNVMNMGADVNIAVLDSCASGAFTRLKGGSRDTPFLIDESITTKGHAFLTSSSEDEAAQESDSIGGSFFTHYLVSALRGAADSTRDGTVTLHEAYTYAFNETRTRTSTTLAGTQHPAHQINLTGSGDLVLTDLRAASAGIVLTEELAGRAYIKDESGRIVAEIRKEAGFPLTIALPEGRYNVTLEDSSGLSVASISLSGSQKIGVQRNEFRSITPEVATRRGNEPAARELPGMDDPKSFDEIITEAVDDLIHLSSVLALIPDIPLNEDENRYVVDDFSLKLIGRSYRIDGLDIGMLNFITEDLNGVQLAAISNFVGEDVNGVQAAGTFNILEGDVDGVQLAGVFNITSGEIDGAQAAGVFNIAGGDASFFQGAGVFNIADGGVDGFQGSGVFNIANGDVNGFQGAGVFNIAEGEVDGFQGAGVFNIAGGVDGVQAATVNTAGRVDGIQIGVVNVGGTVHGGQIGLINISREFYGLPIGLINIAGNGLFAPQAWSDDRGFTYGGLQFGAGAMYTLVFGGAPYQTYQETAAVGAGFGLHFVLGSLYIDGDVSIKGLGSGTNLGESIVNAALNFKDVFTGDIFGGSVSWGEKLYPALRTTVGFEVFNSLAIFGGMSLEAHIPGFNEKTSYFHAGTPWSIDLGLAGTSLDLYPRWYLGLRL
jgi:hypothetical protein